MKPLEAYIDGVGILGPGINDWSSARDILTGHTAYEYQSAVLPSPTSLPPAERRRCGPVVKLTLAVGFDAAAAAAVDVKTLPTVFSASSGNAAVIHDICEILASNDRRISPTQFHLSVHNAASGFWSIATGAMAATSVLCAYDASFGAGLLEAITQAVVDEAAVMLLAYDTSYPDPLRSVRSISEEFGIALVLRKARSERSLAKVGVGLTHAMADRMANPALEGLRTAVPSARGLPLLSALAHGEGASLVLDYLENTRLSVSLSPCR
jgi:hypothetical protein